MSNVLCIMRRDLGAYFTTPIGYIFMMVFVTISVGIFITGFFTMPVADMRPYFDNLPLLLCVFIPAVTMRIWAEERKENTWEMLLTFPMKAWELVLGKFFAALIFFALSLAATVTIPAMLYSLGDPDTGALVSGYLGALMLGAFFLALGIFFSGFFKDQIVAFVVALLTCFALFLLGTQFIAGYLDDRVSGMGSLLSRLLGVFNHYGAFTRGVIDLANIVYFAVWTVLFLVLNILYIDGRNRPGAKTVFSAAVGLCVAIGLLFNWLMVGQSFLRFDMTEDKIYTVSDASKEILRDLDAPVHVRFYVSRAADMPTGMKELEQDVTDKLEELRVASGGRVDYSTIYLEVANVFADPEDFEGDEEARDEAEEALERRMLDKGVEPFTVQAMTQDEFTNRMVYASLGIAYRDNPEEIIPRVMPQEIPELEYRIVSSVYKMSRPEPPVVALVAPTEAFHIDPQMRQIMAQMGQQIPETDDPYIYLEQILRHEKYDVRRVELTEDSPLPGHYDTLVVVNPRELNDRQRWEINRALRAGKSVVLAVQQYEWDYRPTRQGISVTRREENPRINELLEHYGLRVSEDILMDVNKAPLTIGGGGLADMLMGGQTVNLPMHMLIQHGAMDQEMSITNRLDTIFYLWGTAIELDEERLDELGLRARPIMHTSSRAWSVPSASQLSSASFDEPTTPTGPYPIMAVVEGQFPDAFEGMDRPAWPEPDQQPGMPPPPPTGDDPPAPPIEAQPGKLVLIGGSQMFRKNFLQAGNLDLFLNTVDAVTLDENLVYVRGRRPINRLIDRPTEGQRTMWRVANYGLANLVIASIGIGLAVTRRRQRNAYTVAQIRKQREQG